MTQDPRGLDYNPTPAGTTIKGTGGNNLSIAKYGRLRLLVDQGVENAKGPTRELGLERVVHVSNIRQHNMLSMKQACAVF